MLILGIIGILFVLIGVMALMSDEKPKPKAKSKKKRKRTVWDDDPFYGTPLQKIK